MRGPGLDTIHSALRSTAFDLYNDHDEDLARDCLLGAEVLGIQDPIGAFCNWGSVSCSQLSLTPLPLLDIRTLDCPLLVPSSPLGLVIAPGRRTDGMENEGAHVRSRATLVIRAVMTDAQTKCSSDTFEPPTGPRQRRGGWRPALLLGCGLTTWLRTGGRRRRPRLLRRQLPQRLRVRRRSHR